MDGMPHGGIEAQFNLKLVFRKFPTICSRKLKDNLTAMATCYIHIPSPTERGGLTAKELLYARMPCYFGFQDSRNGRFSCQTGEGGVCSR
jgi:hypothetical protein